MTKIIIYAMNFFPEIIGAGKYTGELAFHLETKGHDVEVVTTPPHYPGWKVQSGYSAWCYRREQRGRIRIWRCPIIASGYVGGLWRALPPLSFAISSGLLAFVRIIISRPNVLLCIEPTIFAAPIAICAAKLVGTRIVLHVQDLEVDAAFEIGKMKSGWLRRTGLLVERFSHSMADRIVTISHRMRDRLVAKGIDQKRISIIRNWVDLSKIYQIPSGVPNFYRNSLHLQGKRVVLYSGHIGAKQGIDTLMECARISLDKMDIHFVICGEGPKKISLQAAYGHLRNVSFLPLQPLEMLNELLNLADIHVLPQERAAADLVMPSKLAGMLASGRAIIATADQDTELSELLTGVAIVTPPGDEHALSKAISCLSFQEIAAFGNNSLGMARIFDSKELMADFEKILFEQCAAENFGTLDKSTNEKSGMGQKGNFIKGFKN